MTGLSKVPLCGFEAPASTPRPWGEPISVGILGGMGPYATIQFMKNVLDLTPDKKDWEHVRMIVDSNCHIPSRTRAILFDEASPLPGMIDSCKRLMHYPVDVIALPCNSACYWLPELRKAIKTPILDIVEIAVQSLMQNPAVERVAALSGEVPYRTNLYEKAILRRHGTYVKLYQGDQYRVVSYIESVKSLGNPDITARAEFFEFVEDIASRYELEGVVLACTEFSLLWDTGCNIPVVDSSRALAQAVVDYAYHGKPLSLNVEDIKDFWEERAHAISRGEFGLLQATMLTSSEAEADEQMLLERDTLLSVLAPLLSPSSRVLELGCGTGRWTRILASRVEHVDAWDYSEGLLTIAQEETNRAHINNVTFSLGSVETVVGSGRYDLVISIALLHYLNEDQFLGAIEVVRKNVPVNGYAVFRETFGVDRRFELHGFYSTTLNHAYNAVYRTPREIQKTLGEAFEMTRNEVTLEPTQEKSETAQGVLVFRRRH